LSSARQKSWFEAEAEHRRSMVRSFVGKVVREQRWNLIQSSFLYVIRLGLFAAAFDLDGDPVGGFT
jgi:hypothetical protein